MNSLIENETVTGVSVGDGGLPTAYTDTGDDPQVLEQYGFASRPSGNGTALVFAPGGEQSDRVALCVAAPGGRPATDAGDVQIWTLGGHLIALDNDGDMDMTARPASSVTINVDTGESVNIGGAALAKSLTKWPAFKAAFDAGLSAGIAFVGTPADPGGLNAGLAFAAFQTAFEAAIVIDSPEAQKAKAQ